MSWVCGFGSGSPSRQPPGSEKRGRTGCWLFFRPLHQEETELRRSIPISRWPTAQSEQLKNEEQMLKSRPEKDRVYVAGLGNDFWNLPSNDLDKDTLFSSSVYFKHNLSFCLTWNSQNSNSHQYNLLPCLCGEEFVHLCRHGLTLTIHACITSWQNHSPWYTWHKAFSTWKLQLIQGGAFYTTIRRSCYHQQPVVLSISAFFIPHTPYCFLISITDFSFTFWFWTSDCSMRWVQINWPKKTQSNLQETRQWLSTALLLQWNCLR